MADPTRRHTANVSGPWFVDVRCISCDTCTDISPEIFGRDAARKAYVRAYLPADAALFRGALESCPVEAVGDEADPDSLEVRG
jgi:ferredoxin